MTMRSTTYDSPPRLPDGDTVRLSDILPGDLPFELEIGPGRGLFMVERCHHAAEVRIMGFEIKRKWSCLVDQRLSREGFGDRARVFCEDARLALPRLRPDGGLARVFIHFPDPWWKKRHRKRLVIGENVLDEIARLLCDGGELFIQTDVMERAEQYRALVDAHVGFEGAGDEVDSAVIAQNPFDARGNREHRADDDGLPVYRLLYRRRHR